MAVAGGVPRHSSRYPSMDSTSTPSPSPFPSYRKKFSSLRRLIGISSGRRGGAPEPVSATGQAITSGGSESSSRPGVLPRPCDPVGRRDQRFGSVVRMFMEKKRSSKAGSSNGVGVVVPPGRIVEDLKKTVATGGARKESNLASLRRKLFQKAGSGGNRALTKALTEGKTTLEMVLQSERELLSQNTEYEAEISQPRLLLDEKEREVDKSKDLCLKHREDIKAQKNVNAQLQVLLEKQGSELKQAKHVIPILQKQVTSLTGPLQCLAEDLAEEVSSEEQIPTGSPDDMLLNDPIPCLSPCLSKAKSKEMASFQIGITRSPPEMVVAGGVTVPSSRYPSMDSTSTSSPSPSSSRKNLSSLRRLIGNSSGRRGGAPEPVSAARKAVTSGGSESSSRALVLARPGDLVGRREQRFGSVGRMFMEKKRSSKAGLSDGVGVVVPPGRIVDDLKKTVVAGGVRKESNLASLRRKPFQKAGLGGDRAPTKVLTKVKMNTRTLEMVLRSERELLSQNTEYEAEFSQLRLLLDEKEREVDKLKDLCLKQREEIKAHKNVNAQLQVLLEKQGSELKQAKHVIPILQKQVTSLTGQLQCLAEDLAEEVSSKEQIPTGSPDHMLLKDPIPYLSPCLSKAKSKEMASFQIGITRSPPEMAVADSVTMPSSRSPSMDSTSTSSPSPASSCKNPSSLRRLIGNSSGRRGGALEPVSTAGKAVTGGGSESSSRALVLARPGNPVGRREQRFGSVVRLFMEKKGSSKAGSSDGVGVVVPPGRIVDDLKKTVAAGGARKESNLVSLHRKRFQKASSGGYRAPTKALTEVKTNTRTLAMVLQSERELLSQNTEYEAEISQLRLLLDEREREVDKLKDLCLKQREEIKALKNVNAQLQVLLEKQGSELKQAKHVIPILLKQVTSLIGQLQCLAEDLAEELSSEEQIADDMFLKDLNPCLTP